MSAWSRWVFTVTRAAAGLGVSRKALSGVLDGSSPVSTDMAFRFAQAFGSAVHRWPVFRVPSSVFRPRTNITPRGTGKGRRTVDPAPNRELFTMRQTVSRREASPAGTTPPLRPQPSSRLRPCTRLTGRSRRLLRLSAASGVPVR